MAMKSTYGEEPPPSAVRHDHCHTWQRSHSRLGLTQARGAFGGGGEWREGTREEENHLPI